ncbi:MAG TPA: hypothetical protein VF491_01295 [Vicinamibacterales bacterium]
MIPGRQYTPADVLRILQRRAMVTAGAFLAISAIVIAVVQSLPNRFRSEAIILVTSERVPEDLVPATVTIRVDEQLRQLTQQLASRTLLESVITEFKLYPLTADGKVPEESVEEMRDDVALDPLKGDAFRVSYVSQDPVTAWRVTERLANLLVAENVKQRTNFAEGINSFLDTQLAEVRTKLALQEKRIDDYRRIHPTERPGQSQSDMMALTTATTTSRALSDSLDRDRDRLAAIERNQDVRPAAAAATRSALLDQLDSARQTLTALAGRLTPEHPDLIRQRRIVDNLQAEVNAAPPITAPPVATPSAETSSEEVRLIRERITAKEAEQRRLVDSLNQLQKRIDAGPAQEAEFAALTRDYATLQTLYRDLLTKENESQIAASLERRQVDQRFRVLDPARLPERPFGPRRVRLLLLGVLAALGAAMALGGVLEMRDPRIHVLEDLSAITDLPVFAVVNEIATEPQLARHRVLQFASTAALVLVGLALAWWSIR